MASTLATAAASKVPWKGSDRPWLRTMLLAMLVLSPVLRLASYQPFADGARGQYVRAVLFGTAAAAVVWLLVRVQCRPGSLLPWLCALAVLVSGDAVHYARLANPAAWQPELLLAADDFSGRGPDGRPAEARWGVEVKPGASVTVAGDLLYVQNAPNALGFVELQIPPRPKPTEGRFWLPLGLYTDTFSEALEWDAQVQLQNQFYILAEVKHLLMQATRYGLHLTYAEPGGQVGGHEVNLPIVGDSRPHQWRLERTPQVIRLLVDGREVWSRPQAGLFEYVRFGETRTDDLHGGTLLLDNVRYWRKYR